MKRSLSRGQAAVLGLVLLLGLGLGVAGLFLVGSRHWFAGRALELDSGVRSAQGVEVGTRVRVQGVEAGEVVAVVPPAEPGAEVRLRLRVRAPFRPLIRQDATVQIVSEGLIGGKVVEVYPGTPAAAPAEDGGRLASRPSTELTDVLDEMKQTLSNVRDGQGALGQELMATVREARTTFQSVGKTGDALRGLPIIRDYARDAETMLVRPRCDRMRTMFAEADLFEPGRAALTPDGKKRLDEVVPRLKGGLRHEGADLVVVALADPKQARPQAKKITADQSAAVCDYLRDQHSVQKAGWLTWREMTALGLGTAPYPGEDDPGLPAARVEVLVFVPQK